MRVLWGRKREYSDVEVVEGLQRREAAVEEWFYDAAKRYFNASFNEVFFDKEKRQEIFQTAFIKLWTEIENKRIKVVEGCISRQQRNGAYETMSCSLTTFLMAFAKTEYRELVRNLNDCSYELYDTAVYETNFALEEECNDVEEMKNRIVDECIMGLSPSCIEIITMFYYKGMSLDEILDARGEKNRSKDGLKAAKNKCLSTLRMRVLKEYAVCDIG